jgi:hypothetical protein
MIARTWSGAVRTPDADEYATYIRETGFAEYRSNGRKPRRVAPPPRRQRHH